MLVTNRNVSRKLDYLLLLQIIFWSIWFCIIDFDWQMRLWDADFDWLKRLFDSIHNICSFAIITSTSSTWQQLWKWEGGGGLIKKKTPLITSFKKLWKKTKKSWKGAGPTLKDVNTVDSEVFSVLNGGLIQVVFSWITTLGLCWVSLIRSLCRHYLL